jgi:multimeric flavodoxin WrbA
MKDHKVSYKNVSLCFFFLPQCHVSTIACRCAWTTGLRIDIIRSGKGVVPVKIAAIYGSPRRNGNTAALLDKATAGAEAEGAHVEKIVLRDLKMSPCLEIYGCMNDGKCVITDDFAVVRDTMLEADGIMLASPIFFYTVSAHTKILMDRCQSLWVKKYMIEQAEHGTRPAKRRAVFISVGATRGKKLFDGALLTVKYFLDTLDAELWKSLVYRGLDQEGDVQDHPEYLSEAEAAGAEFARVLKTPL